MYNGLKTKIWSKPPVRGVALYSMHGLGHKSRGSQAFTQPQRPIIVFCLFCLLCLFWLVAYGGDRVRDVSSPRPAYM